MEEVVIKLAKRADIPLLPKIERQAAKIFPVGLLPDPSATMPMAHLTRAQEHGLLWVAEIEGQLVAFAAACLEEQSLFLDEVDVHPDHAGKKIGAKLIQALIQKAKELNLPSVTLTTFSHLGWNAPYYEKLGFCILAEDDCPIWLLKNLHAEKEAGLINRVAMINEL